VIQIELIEDLVLSLFLMAYASALALGLSKIVHRLSKTNANQSETVYQSTATHELCKGDVIKVS